MTHYWTSTVIVVLIYSFVMAPIEKKIYGKVRNKFYAYILTALVAAIILLGLLQITSILGFGPFNRN